MTRMSEKIPPKKVATSCTTPEPEGVKMPSSEVNEVKTDCKWVPLCKKLAASATPSLPGTWSVFRYSGSAERNPVASVKMGGKKKYTRQKTEPSTNTYMSKVAKKRGI